MQRGDIYLGVIEWLSERQNEALYWDLDSCQTIERLIEEARNAYQGDGFYPFPWDKED
jgi:hypothetical protein